MQVDGVNLLRIPAKDAYSYGRALLDQLFTKREQKVSVVLKTKKSEKPPLSPPRVEKMFGTSLKIPIVLYTLIMLLYALRHSDIHIWMHILFTDCIQRRYGTGYDHKTLMV